MWIKDLAKIGLKKTGYAIGAYESVMIGYAAADQISRIRSYLRLLEALSDYLSKEEVNLAISNLLSYKSQIGQDMLCLLINGFRREGYFFEFGAADGLSASNSYILEKIYDWRGIVAEPARGWQNSLSKNRTCNIETSCVWKDSNTIIPFKEVAHEFGTIAAYASNDHWASTRAKGKEYKIKTISLNDMLAKFNAPHLIDFLSIDTEGSEFEILNVFDFSKYSCRLIAVEHNYTDNRDKIAALLNSAGYKQLKLIDTRFDDWYVMPDYLPDGNWDKLI